MHGCTVHVECDTHDSHLMHACGNVQRVLICGWGSSTFMIDLLRALDLELPLGSEVTLFNLRVNDTVISEMLLAPTDGQKSVHTDLQPATLVPGMPDPSCNLSCESMVERLECKSSGFYVLLSPLQAP